MDERESRRNGRLLWDGTYTLRSGSHASCPKRRRNQWARFGAGAILAMDHDWRVMREGRGYLWFPEVDINIPLASRMAALIKSKLTPCAALNAMSTGYRYGGPEAFEAGLIDNNATATDLHQTARKQVAGLAVRPPAPWALASP